MEENKKPLQEEKEVVKQELLNSEPKKKRGRPKKTTDIPVVDIQAVEQEARFFLSMIQSGREMVGVKKPINDMPAMVFIQSYKGLVMKYGDVATKWMPEILFISSVGLILHDTYSEIKVQKIKKKVEQKGKSKKDDK